MNEVSVMRCDLNCCDDDYGGDDDDVNNNNYNSSVGIATRYELDGPGIESLWGRDFPHPSRPPLGPTQPPVQWVPGHCRGVKRPGRGADPPPPSLYLYLP